MNRIAILSSWCLALALVAGCANEPAADPAASEPASAAAPLDRASRLRAAIDDPARSEEDRADDANRKPGAVLEFLGIAPGMRVLDLLAGGGYYSEILSRYLGSEGRVIIHDNPAYMGFIGETINQRLAEGRLVNAELRISDLDELELEQGSLDAVILVLGYHDLYWKPEDGSWPPVDRQRLLAELREALVPGGIFGIVDHSASPGGDTVAVVGSLHRIDESVVRREVEAAGFVLDGESDALRNPEDSRALPVFDPAIRRRTDQFVLRYKKPA